MDLLESKKELINIVSEFNRKYELSEIVGEDYYEPGMMENLRQYYGQYNEVSNTICIRFDSKGLRYDNRTPRLNTLMIGEKVHIVRDPENEYNYNNFEIQNTRNESLGYLPKELCNALAPLVDKGYATIVSSKVSYIEKLSERSRYAKQGVLFVEATIQLKGI